MRLILPSLAVFTLVALAGAQQPSPRAGASLASQRSGGTEAYVGFDLNNYPGDQALPTLRQHFSFVGYWLNNPPGERQNNWRGKRDLILRQGFGFLVLFNGRLDAEIVKAQKSGTLPATLGKNDAVVATVAAHREGFPSGTILFLDQEEGGRLLPEQADYLLAWTEAVARAGYRPGVYGSGQPVNEGHGHTITTAEDIRTHVATQHLHPIVLWVVQDTCPPSNGCTMQPPPLTASGTSDAAVWQYAQSPQRRSFTAACAKTYARDGNCYAPDAPGVFLDLDTAASPDPSHGR